MWMTSVYPRARHKPAHGGALLKLHTGADNFVRPSMGAWVGYGLGTENENLPSWPFVRPSRTVA